DLYTGRGRLYKAGAAPSYLVTNGKLKELEGAGLPVGILKEVQGEEHRFSMGKGDWVVMVSDGALSDGEIWLRQQVELCAAVGSSPQEMADIVADAARRRQPAAAPPDDITVAVMKLERPV
ncbi:MAG: SpoIIE family protein phosphatase, partial [Oscillospiraceae bacterium]|nr:SpoIIE family protein phosphatase [Oscillospiraceae bacterium]